VTSRISGELGAYIPHAARNIWSAHRNLFDRVLTLKMTSNKAKSVLRRRYRPDTHMDNSQVFPEEMASA
jgi:hypothetical protein